MEAPSWLLFLPQAPATSSTLRVQIWRHLRAAGAITLQNGVWVLPHTDRHEQFCRQERDDIVAHGGTALLLLATPIDLDLIARFRAERDHEYAEVIERCQGLLDELARETSRVKFTFAELEENEQAWQQLSTWLANVQARDFFGGTLAAEAKAWLARCAEALHTFAQAVYAHEGVANDQEGGESHAPEEGPA
jgi:hypothetical protein